MASQVCNYTEAEPGSDLSNKVVMVTGASSGLGLEFCLDLLAKTGCKVVAAARRMDKLLSLCQEINQLHGDSSVGVHAIAIDLDLRAKSPTIEASVKKAWEVFGRIDALINNAGVRGRVHSSLDLTEEEWDDICNTNVKETRLVSKYVCIRDSKQEGLIINISSIAGLNRGQLPGCLVYASSNTAINAVTNKIIVQSLQLTGIQDVDAVCTNKLLNLDTPINF